MRRLLLAAAALGCQALPEPLTRVEQVSPAGTVEPGAVAIEVRFTAPVAPEGLVDGRRVALCRAEDAAELAAAASAADGIPAGAPALAAEVELVEGGRSLQLRPARALWPMASWALVLGKGVRDAEGRPVLDPAGRQRALVHAFDTGDLAPGALPPLALTEALARAAAPAAGGEYAEVANLGDAPVDLAGFRLAKRTASGGEQRCTLEPMAGAALAAGRRGLLVGGSWDGRYALPADTPRWRCGATALLGGLADDRPVALRLETPGGAPLSGLGWEAVAPRCAGQPLLRLEPDGPDTAANLACGEGSPGE